MGKLHDHSKAQGQRRRRSIALIVGIGLIVAMGSLLGVLLVRPTLREGPRGANPGVENRAPDFALPALDGREIRLSAFRGKAVLLNFWASWCAPCRAEMPDLNAVYREHEDRLVVLGINLMEDPETVRAFLDEVPVDYPIVLDQEGEVTRLYRLRTQPVTYLLDAQGVIVGRKFGAFTPKELSARVDALLKASATSRPARPPQAQAPAPALRRATARRLNYLGEGELTRFLRDRPELAAHLDPNAVPYVPDLAVEQLKMGCPIVDCIPSIDGPSFEPPEEASRWLQPGDLVLGMEAQGVAKAYPLKILTWHEIVNDTFGDEPIVITYCPLCYSGVAFRRTMELEGQTRVLEFGVSGRLYKSDLVMYDRQTGTFWSQLEGRGIVGPLAGRTLERLPVDVLPWAEWLKAHPDTRVLARPTVHTPVGGQPPLAERRRAAKANPLGNAATAQGEFLRDYEKDPYVWYYRNDYDTFGTSLRDRRLRAKAVVWGLELNGQAKAYEEAALQGAGALDDVVGGVPIRVVWERGTARAFAARPDGPQKPLPLVRTFWFAWAAFHPDTALFALEPEGEGDGGH